jgi:ABC-2 type transport system permease protein
MNPEANAAPQSAAEGTHVEPRTVTAGQAFYWCLRRELFEYRSVYIAPLAAAGVFLFGFLFGTIHLPARMRAAIADPGQIHSLAVPYEYAAAAIMLVAMVVQLFYCLDALQSERRDRSILFWKSLPVSDFTTVLAKASIPFAILPVLSFSVVVLTGFVMLLLSSLVLAANGLSAAPLWTQLHLVSNSLGLLYHLVIVHVLWYAPVYGWLLFVSAWSRRAALLWAVLPPLGFGFLEKLIFGSSHFGMWMMYRFTAGMEAEKAPGTMGMNPMTHNTPGRFFSTPGLWIGLLVTGIFLFAAMRIRRHREPI